MIVMLPWMLAIVATWIALGAAFAGIGLAFLRVAGSRGESADDLLRAFWPGWALGLGFLQLWHFVLPVDGRALAAVVALGLGGLAWARREMGSRGGLGRPGFRLRPLGASSGLLVAEASASDFGAAGEEERNLKVPLPRAGTDRNLKVPLPGTRIGAGSEPEGPAAGRPVAAWGWLCVLVTAGFAVWLANRAMGPIGPYDAGLYHLSAIRWAHEHPIAAGLANLHARLGFNNASFLYMAMCGSGPWESMAHPIGNGLLILALAARSLWALARLASGVRAGMEALLAAVFFPATVGAALEYASSTSPDLPAFALGAALALELGRALDGRDGEGARREALAAIPLLAAAAVAVKLSAVVMAALAVLVVLAWGLRRSSRAAGTGRAAVAGLAAAAALGGAWVARGVVLSGYPAFPSTMAGASLPWTASPEAARGAARGIRNWARCPETPELAGAEGLGWVRPWARQVLAAPQNVRLLAPPAVAAAAGLFLALVRRRTFPRIRAVVFLLPAAGGLLFWFATAPDPRFARALFWWAGGGLLTLSLAAPGGEGAPRAAARLVALAAVAASALLLLPEEKLLGPGSPRGFHPVPVAEVRPVETRSGLVLWTPAAGDRCWDAPLPCTPTPSLKLRLRRDGDLASGFVKN